MLAMIRWISEREGGRRRLPPGDGPPYYSPEVRFPDHPWPNPDDAWTVVVRKDRETSDPLTWVADVGFRVKEAPRDFLREGREFELFEGKHCVARGKLVVEADVEEHPESEALGPISR